MFQLDQDMDSTRGGTPARATRFGKPVDEGRVLRGLFRQRWFIGAAMVLAVVSGVVVAEAFVAVTYAAQTVFVWEASEGGGTPNVRELRTLVDSVKLPTNLAIVREALGIDATLDRLAARLDVRFDRDSNLVTVRAEADSPEGAVALSQTAVSVFLDHQREVARERLEEEVADLQADVGRARERLADAQSRYDAFRREHGVADFTVEQQQAIELAASLRAQADIARADAQAASARRVFVPVARETESPQLGDARRRLDSARARLSEDHPRVRALAAEVAALRRAERGSTAAPGASAAARAAGDRAAAQRRQESYESMEQAARERLTLLSSVEGEASALLASVHVAEGHVADVEADLARAQDAVRAASPGFRVVAPALLPEEAERSYRKPVAVALPIVLSLLLLVGLVAYELRGFRVKTANELAYWGRAPVVAATTWPSSSGELAPVIYELSDAAALAGGRTVVIAASELEEEVAADVTELLRVTVTIEQRELPRYRADDDDVLITEAPAGQVIVTAAPGRSELAIRPGGGAPKLLKPPEVAQREEKVITRRRGSRLEQVHISTARVLLEDDRGPAEIVGQEGGSGDAFVRRTSRTADRVLVVVRSGRLSWARASELRAMVGREDDGVGFLLVGVPSWLAMLADRAGPVAAFWRATRDD